VIAQAAPHLRIARYRSNIDAAIKNVLEQGPYISGHFVETFEAEFCQAFGYKACVGVGSGTAALTLALQACGVEPGDEVITVSLTAAGTAQAIAQCGATPVFVDVERNTRCMDVALVEAAITPRTRAILPVHLFGMAANMPALVAVAKRHGLAVVEDCAQAVGTTIAGRYVGSFGTAAAFSFYPTKNLGCVGDGGAVVSADENILKKVRQLANYGWTDSRRISECVAGNSRLAAMQAAILSALLPFVKAGNLERRECATTYRNAFEALPIGLPIDQPGATYHQFAVEVAARDVVMQRLLEFHKIQTAVHYTPALHHQPVFKTSNQAELPHTDYFAAHLLSLPVQQEVVCNQLEHIIAAVTKEISR